MEILSRSSLRICHVEDDNDYASIGEIFLGYSGFTEPIIRCHDGAEALRYFSTVGPKQAPHVILLDLHMPNLNGLEVLHWLRHGHTLRMIPVFLLTSSDEPEDRRRAAADGVTGYLLKTPFFGEVIRCLDEQIVAINHRHHQKARAKQSADAEPFVLNGDDLPVSAADALSDSQF